MVKDEGVKYGGWFGSMQKKLSHLSRGNFIFWKLIKKDVALSYLLLAKSKDKVSREI